MESKYIINVAENVGERVDGSTKWAHFFKVDAGSSYEKSQDIFYSLKNAYPEHNVTVVYWGVTGREVKI